MSTDKRGLYELSVCKLKSFQSFSSLDAHSICSEFMLIESLSLLDIAVVESLNEARLYVFFSKQWIGPSPLELSLSLFALIWRLKLSVRF